MKSLKPTNIISIFYISFFWLVYWVYILLYGIISIFYISFFWLNMVGLLGFIYYYVHGLIYIIILLYVNIYKI
jgi:hypothetical protein